MGYFDGNQFISFSAPASAFGILSIFLVAVRYISLKNCIVTFADFLLTLIAIYFLLSALISDQTLLSLKRWATIIVPGACFYLLGRSIKNPMYIMKRQGGIFGFSILVQFAYALVIFIVAFPILNGNMHVWLSEVSLFENISIGQTYAGRFIGDYFIYRPSSLFPNPNGFAVFALIAFAFSIIDWERKPSWFYIVVAIILGTLFWTASRAAILGLLVFLVIYIISVHQTFNRYVPHVIFITLCIPIAFYTYTLFLYSPSPFIDSFEIFELRERGVGWKIALDSFSIEGLLMGEGFGVSKETVLGDKKFVFSVWIVLLIEVGVIGVGLVVLLWFAIVFKCYQAVRKLRKTSCIQRVNAIFLALLMALYVHQAFDLSAFRLHPLNFFIFSFLGLATHRELKTDQTADLTNAVELVKLK